MRASDGPALWLADIRLMTSMLTRLPVRQDLAAQGADFARAGRVNAVVGAGIGLIGALAYWIGAGLGLPFLPAALVAVAATVLFTGAFHEDGLGDVADGLGGAFEPARKLEIMRDSRIGTYGTAAIFFSLALRAGALAALAEPALVAAALIAAHGAARAFLPAVMYVLPLARSDGLAAGASRPEGLHAVTALALGAGLAALVLGPGTGLAAVLAGAAAAAVMAAIARRQIGGYTGDVLGAVEQCAEIAILLAVTAL